VELSFLAIVFDGRLFEAIVDKGKPALEERKHILLHFIYRPRNSFKNLNFWIDVVHKEFFCAYMTQILQDISFINSKLRRDKNTISQYLLKG
jgi:hypothetical protein